MEHRKAMENRKSMENVWTCIESEWKIYEHVTEKLGMVGKWTWTFLTCHKKVDRPFKKRKKHAHWYTVSPPSCIIMWCTLLYSDNSMRIHRYSWVVSGWTIPWYDWHMFQLDMTFLICTHHPMNISSVSLDPHHRKENLGGSSSHRFDVPDFWHSWTKLAELSYYKWNDKWLTSTDVSYYHEFLGY